VYWLDPTARLTSLLLAKRSFDIYLSYEGGRGGGRGCEGAFVDVRTVYAGELYGGMLTHTGHIHTAAHVYNITGTVGLSK